MNSKKTRNRQSGQFSRRKRHSDRESARRYRRRTSLRFEPLETRNLLAGDVLDGLEFLPADEAADEQFYSSTMLSTVLANATVGAEGESAAEGEDAPDLVAFAKALADAGVKYYGAFWCAHCTTQKELFQDGAHYLPFIEVTNPDRTLNEIGTAAGVESLPTWEFPDETRLTGQQTLETISQRSGVAIPTSSTPSLGEIDDATLLAGSPLHVVLDGYDPNGDALTYTVTSSNPLVTATMPEGNRSWRINVSSWGEMIFQLYEQRAPRPTGRIIELTEDGFFDGIIFHRVIEDFVIQAGDPTGTGTGGSTLGDFDDQFHNDLQHNRDGILSYAKSSDDTNDSQFFVTLDPTRHLDFNHSIFGQLIEGDAVLKAIGDTVTGTNDKPTTDITIESAEIFTDTENSLVMLKADPAAVGQTSTITVTAEDADGNQTQTSFLVTVAADTVNGGPYLADLGPFTTPHDTPIEIQLQGIDVEGDAIYYDAVEVGSVAYTLDVDHDTGLVTVTPPQGYVGDMEVLVAVRPETTSDTGDTYDRQYVNIEVSPAAPTLSLVSTSDSGVIGDNVTNVTDLTFRVSNVTDGATVKIMLGESVLGQGTVTGTTIDIATDNLAALGDGSYDVTAVQTTTGGSSVTSEELTVVLDTTAPDGFLSTPPANAAPGVDVLYNTEHAEEGTAGFAYSLQNGPSGATIDANTGVFQWTPTQGNGGTNDFQIVATDLAGNTSAQDVGIEVSQSEQIVRMRLVLLDLDQNPITQIAAGEDFLLQVHIQDLRTDADGVFAAYMDILYDQALVSVVGTSINDITFANLYQNGKSGSLTTPGILDDVGAFGPTTATGPAEQLLFTVRMSADAAGDAIFSFDPADNVGNEILVFGENDPIPMSQVTVVPTTLTIDDGLVAEDDVFNVDEDSQDVALDVITPNDTSAAGNPITILATGPTNHGGTVEIVTGGLLLSYTPAANFVGEETFTYTISDGALQSTATVTVQVFPVNDPPVANDDSGDDFVIEADSDDNFLNVLANDTTGPDTDETLRITAVGTGSAGGTITIGPNGTHLVYSPRAGYTGQETFTYTISDRSGTTGLTDTATVTVSVESGTRPTLGADTATAEEDGDPVTINVLANDTPAVAGATLTVTNVTQPASGSTVAISGTGTTVTYTPRTNFFGTETFTYTVTEQDGGSSTGTVTVTVNPQNDPPTANNDAFTVSQDAVQTTLDVLANDTYLPDAEEALTITAVTQGSQGGTVAIAADGKTVLYTPPEDFLDTETFTYTIEDPDGEESVATVTIDVVEYTPRTISGQAMNLGYSLGRLPVSLEGVDDFGNAVALTTMTAWDGSYDFGDLPPGQYTVKQTANPVFMMPTSNELSIDSGMDDGDSTGNNLPYAGRQAKYISIADYLGNAPHQTSRSPSHSILIAVTPGVGTQWFSTEAGWEDYQDGDFSLSEDLTELTMTVADNSGVEFQATIPTDTGLVRFLGQEGESYLLRLTGSPNDLGLQPVPAAAGEAEGEAAPIASTVAATPATVPPVVVAPGAEGEAAPVAVPPAPAASTTPAARIAAPVVTPVSAPVSAPVTSYDVYTSLPTVTNSPPAEGEPAAEPGLASDDLESPVFDFQVSPATSIAEQLETTSTQPADQASAVDFIMAEEDWTGSDADDAETDDDASDESSYAWAVDEVLTEDLLAAELAPNGISGV